MQCSVGGLDVDMIEGSDWEARLNAGEGFVPVFGYGTCEGTKPSADVTDRLKRLSSPDKTVWSTDSLRWLLTSSLSSSFLLRRRENTRRKGFEKDLRTIVYIYESDL